LSLEGNARNGGENFSLCAPAAFTHSDDGGLADCAPPQLLLHVFVLVPLFSTKVGFVNLNDAYSYAPTMEECDTEANLYHCLVSGMQTQVGTKMFPAYEFPDAAQIAAARTHAGTPRQAAGLPAGMVIAEASADPPFNRTALSVNGTVGVGTQIVAADLDHDGDIDLAVAGKLGVHVLENLEVNRVGKEIREQTQPLNRKWPFEGEGADVPQEDGPTVPK